MLLAKKYVNTIEALISKALIDSNINHDEFFSVNNVLRAYYKMKILKILWNIIHKYGCYKQGNV